MAIFKPIFSEDNWQEILFDDSKLEGHSFPYNDNRPDLSNPYFKRIQLNRDIHLQWEEYCEKQHDRSGIDWDLDVQYGINLARIILHNPDLPSMSTYASDNELVYAAQRYAVETYDRKGLNFHVKIAEAIAKPDEWRVSPEEIAQNNVMIAGRYGYDLSVNLTLTNSDFGGLKEASAFFFAMKVRRIDLMSIDDFLDYQLEASFLGDGLRFGRFLNLLCKKYGSPDETHGFDALLKEVWVDSILGWVEMKNEERKKGLGENNGNGLANQRPVDVSPRTVNPPERIEWFGTQKNLAELFIELERKGWIKHIRYSAIKAAFTGSNSIEQVLKPDEDRKTHVKSYPQVFTTRYKPAFETINECIQLEG